MYMRPNGCLTRMVEGKEKEREKRRKERARARRRVSRVRRIFAENFEISLHFTCGPFPRLDSTEENEKHGLLAIRNKRMYCRCN